jgi:hypothetical protein
MAAEAFEAPMAARMMTKPTMINSMDGRRARHQHQANHWQTPPHDRATAKTRIGR